MTESDVNEFVEDHGGYIDVCVGVTTWVTASGRFLAEADYRVKGEVWRVHKNDADPYPSNPHAHCIAGPERFKGCTLHLGTGQLFRQRVALDRFLGSSKFERLLELIQSKFPDIRFPLET
jgi:hypothetical protein